jgi:hypothetical protein
MRRIGFALLLAAALVVGFGAPATAAPPTKIKIAKTASELFPFDVSIDGSGVFYPASSVRATVSHCPDGLYQFSASMVQDGLPTQWATHGHGAGEIYCDGGSTTFAMGFVRLDPVLHPGRATVTYSIRPFGTGQPIASATRTVTIPESTAL